MFNFTTVVFDGTSPPVISQTLWDGTPQVQTFGVLPKDNICVSNSTKYHRIVLSTYKITQ
jgi:hypothetical protein